MRNYIDIIESASTFRVYHGTDADFDIFDSRLLGSANGKAPINMMGFNFTDNLELAKTFGKNIITADITLNNPLVIDAGGRDYSDFKHELNELLDDVTPEHDGVIIQRYADAGRWGSHYVEGNHYIVFDPRNISVRSNN